jgi:hypothetical protein
VITDDEPEDDGAGSAPPTASSTLAIPELLDELRALHREPPGDDPEWPFLLSAGERRSFTANTIIRDPAWRKRDAEGALRIAPPTPHGSASSPGRWPGSRPARGAPT